MKNYLVRFSADWADEFEAEGFRIFLDTNEDSIQEYIDEVVKNGFYFGTNEGFEEYELSGDNFKIINISDSDSEVFTKFFNRGFGIFP